MVNFFLGVFVGINSMNVFILLKNRKLKKQMLHDIASMQSEIDLHLARLENRYNYNRPIA